MREIRDERTPIQHQGVCKAIMVIITALFLVLATSGSAFAVAWGGNSSFTTAGRTYYGASGAEGGGGVGKAYQRVYVSGSTMPAGYGGIQPRLYTGTALQLSGDWQYNPSNKNAGVAYQGAAIGKMLGSGVSCRGRGYFAGWISAGRYTTMQSSFSPYQNC